MSAQRSDKINWHSRILQIASLELIRDHIATSLSIESEDLELCRSSARWLEQVHQLSGDGLLKLLD